MFPCWPWGLQKGTPEVTAPQMIDAFEGTFGVHAGQRRNHIKGTCAAGQFVGTADAAALSRSALFSGKTIPVVARFSLGGGNPEVPDAAPAPRGMALEFRLPTGGLQHITMIDFPIFGAASPASFREALVAAKPDPKTGKPDPEKLKAYAASHPDAMALTRYASQHTPTANYYQTTYFSIHTFKFVDAKNTEHPVRRCFVPRDGTKQLTAAEMKAAPLTSSKTILSSARGKGRRIWDMIVYVGETGRPAGQPDAGLAGEPQAFQSVHAHHHPGERRSRKVSPCELINFDPLVMVDGMAPRPTTPCSRIPLTGVRGLVRKTPVRSVRSGSLDIFVIGHAQPHGAMSPGLRALRLDEQRPDIGLCKLDGRLDAIDAMLDASRIQVVPKLHAQRCDDLVRSELNRQHAIRMLDIRIGAGDAHDVIAQGRPG